MPYMWFAGLGRRGSVPQVREQVGGPPAGGQASWTERLVPKEQHIPLWYGVEEGWQCRMCEWTGTSDEAAFLHYRTSIPYP